MHTATAAMTATEEAKTRQHSATANSVVSGTKALAKLAAHRVDAGEARSILRQVIDPEMGINIVDLGLVYDIDVHDDEVNVYMTLTSPACPMGPYIVSEAKGAVESLDGVNHCEITLVWEPYWTPDRIDSRLRAYLGY